MLLNCGVGADSWETFGHHGAPSVNPKGHQSWVFFGRTDVEAETPVLWRTYSLENTLMLGKTEGRRRRGWQRIKWLDGITDSMGKSSLNKLQEIVRDREAWQCCSPWVTMSQTWLSNWTTTNFITCYKCTTLVEVVTNGEGYSCFGTDGIWEISVASQFYCELKAALKIKI